VGGVSGPALHPALAAAVEAARAAGEIALRYYRGGFEVTIKPDLTPVTQADREAEQAIRGVLGRAFPEWGLFSARSSARRAAGHALGHRSHRRHQELHPRPSVWAVLIGLEDAAREFDHGRRLQPVHGGIC